MNIRDARPDDVGAMAAIHAEAFAGEIGPLVGDGYLRGFLTWFVTAPEAVALVAEIDGKVAGYVVGAPDGYGPPLTRRLLPVIVKGVLTHLPAIVRHPSFKRQLRARLTNLVLRRDPSNPIFDATPPGPFCLVGIGTRASTRRQGAGRALVEGLCARSGGRAVILDVFSDNRSARTLYERTGFRTLIEHGRVVRMIRTP